MEITKNQYLEDVSGAERPLLGNSVITSHLLKLGYPQKSIDSMFRCGDSTGFSFLKHCACSSSIIKAVHHCSLRTCLSCSKIRKRRISSKYLSFLQSLRQDRKDFLYFLTISPKNYNSIEEGLDHIKKSFNKFLRHNYIKERVHGGLYVIEAKGGGHDWNVHLHAIVYGRWIDNKVRKEKDSKLVRLFKQSSKREVNIHVIKQGSSRFTLNYMLKYISANKDDFTSSFDLAKYIVVTRKRRLVSTFGGFYNIKVQQEIYTCVHCGHDVEYILDFEVVSRFLEFNDLETPPPILDDFF